MRRRPERASAAQAIRPAFSGRRVGAEGRGRRSQPAPGDVFLEIGPGTGALTLPLAATGAPILAVEIDRDLVADLAAARAAERHGPHRRRPRRSTSLPLSDRPRSRSGRPTRAAARPPRRRFRVVGNLPVQPLVADPLPPDRAVPPARAVRRRDDHAAARGRRPARRAARHARTTASLTRARRRCTRTITRLLDLPPGAFRPAPKVRSSRRPAGRSAPPAVRVADEALFERLVKAHLRASGGRRCRTRSSGSTRRRRRCWRWPGIDGRRRPETLQVTEIARLAELFASVRRPRCAIVSPFSRLFFGSLPATHSGRTHRADSRRARAAAVLGERRARPAARVRTTESRSSVDDVGRAPTAPAVDVIPLGGLGEFGMNMLLVACGDTAVLIDAGVMFPGARAVRRRSRHSGPRRRSTPYRGRIAALVLTHGHEDHIGAVAARDRSRRRARLRHALHARAASSRSSRNTASTSAIAWSPVAPRADA